MTDPTGRGHAGSMWLKHPFPEEDDEPSGPVVLRRPAAFFVTALVLVPLVVASVVHQVRTRPLGTPQATVREFLNAAAVDRNGEQACDFLTVRGRLQVERTPARPTCTTFFAASGLSLGGLDVQSNRGLGELTYRVTGSGSTRRVTVSHDGQSIAFVLRPGTPPELGEFRAPPTPWRIASGCSGLSHVAPATLSDT